MLQLQTNIYRKPTSTNSFLHWQSHHPPALKNGIPIGQHLRARRNCSTEVDFQNECRTLYQRFCERGYPKRPLRRAYLRALHTPRATLLTNLNPPPKDSTIRLIGTFDNYAQEIRTILRRHWSILLTDSDLTGVLPTYPSVTYRRGKNLREKLVHSHLKSEPQGGSEWLCSRTIGTFPCGTCSFCPMIPKQKAFINPVDNKIYTIKQCFNCKTSGIIYGALCSCPKIYVGKTLQEFRQRISKHLSAIRTGADTPLARHIREIHHGDLSTLTFWGIAKPKLGPRSGNLDRLLLRTEAEWIYRLK